MNRHLRRVLVLSAALFAAGLLINSLANRATCSYYGYQTDRETRYAAFVGCMIKVSGNWVLRSELRTVQ